MTLGKLQHEISEIYLWHRALGNDVRDGRHCRFVTNVETPDIWVANHVQFPRAGNDTEMASMLAEMDDAFAHCSHRMVLIDPETPDAVTTHLQSLGYHELDATSMMVLTGAMHPTPRPDIAIRAISSDVDWDIYFRLARADHEEGKKTFDMELPEEVTRGLMADIQRKSAHMTMFLAIVDCIPVAFGAAVDRAASPGMIEDLFTLPDHRSKGIATALITHIVATLRAEIEDRPMFLGALESEGAKHLYERLGFKPVSVMREFIADA